MTALTLNAVSVQPPMKCSHTRVGAVVADEVHVGLVAAYSWRPSQLEVGAGGDGLLTSAALLRCQDNGHTRCANLVILLHWLKSLLIDILCQTAHTNTWNADKDHDMDGDMLDVTDAAPRGEQVPAKQKQSCYITHDIMLGFGQRCRFGQKCRTDVSKRRQLTVCHRCDGAIVT